jgi:putative endopeptidase
VAISITVYTKISIAFDVLAFVRLICSMKKIIFCALVSFTICSCQERNQKSGKTLVQNGTKLDLLQSHIDTAILPGNDFFNYANGTWFKNHPIPKSESGYGIFTLVEDENKDRLRKISEEATGANAASGSNTQLIGDFFSAGMDSMGAQKLGINAIKSTLDKINSIATKQDVLAMISTLQKNQIGVAYSVSMYADMKNSNQHLIYMGQGGLGLPDRDYYFNTDEQTKKIKDAYPAHIAKMLAMANPDAEKTAATSANEIIALETALAKNSRKLEAMRDPEKNYNKMTLAQLGSLAPGIDWVAQLKAMNITVDSISVGQPEFFTAFAQILNTTPIGVWKNYLSWQTISAMAPYLSHNFEEENFQFYSAKLNGVKEQRPRWKNVLDAQEGALGDALGQLYVKEYFSDKVRKRYVDLTERIVETYREHISKLDWMGDSTKAKAIVKLNTITKKVGYPDKWKDYSKMNISRTNYAENIMSANRWAFDEQIAKLNKPVDKTEWDMTPQTYNAYYNPSNNEIVLPAAMFTAPGYSDDELDDALVFGYVGASTIGHELTHGFDDEGRKFDEKGNLNNWWTKADEEKFMKKANQLVKQFNAYTVLGNKHPNGEATLGENIADLGGVIIGFDAFTKTKQYKEGKLIGGLTPAQRFFMGYAYGWMQVRTDEKLAAQLLTDVHAPIFLRVNSPMSNSDAWYKAFNVQKGQAGYRDSADRVRIW